MSWHEQLEPDWVHEAPFYLAAIIAHGALLTFNPIINWGGGIAAEKVIPVEFVADIPFPPVAPPAPPHDINPGGDGSNTPPKHGPGEFEMEKVKQGAADPPPQPKPSRKPAAVKSKVNKAGATVHKAATAKSKPRAKPAVDTQAAKFARAVAAEKAAAAKAVAVELAAEKRRMVEQHAAEAKAERERRAAAARVEAERRAEAAREATERKAAALAEKRRLAAEANAARAAKRAELSSALATMADPDEALATAGGPVAGKGGDDGGRGDGEAELAGARKAGAAAALAESVDPGDAAGSGGSDLIDSKARGGGVGPEGGGVSFSVDGPVGKRRILTRVSPTSPDWVATRNLDLTVTVRFQVLPDGSVKPGAVIQKTSGFPDIDRRALVALARWRFQTASSKPGATEVWGRVTFRFTS